MHSENLLFRREENISVITLNRPNRRNALSLQLMRDLIACLNDVANDSSIRALILSANGKVFSSGHDLSELTGQSVAVYREIFDTCAQLMLRVQSIPQPVIAEVQGVATAAGCQLVATCDLAIASTEATFATPGVRIGLFCSTPMVALTRAVGRKRALQMLMTGEAICAQTAAEWGLINSAVAAADLPEATRALARRIASASSLTVGIGKQAFYSQIELDQQRAYNYAKEIMTMNALAQDAQEGITAFIEKRTPAWCGK